MINTCFKFEGKIQNASKVIMFTRNHTDDSNDADDDGTKNNVSPQSGKGGDIIRVGGLYLSFGTLKKDEIHNIISSSDTNKQNFLCCHI